MSGSTLDVARDRREPPYAVLEQLHVGGQEIVRIVGWTRDEIEAHALTATMARAGCRVWLLDLWGQDGDPSIQRYCGPAAAVWANETGSELTTTGGSDRATEAGV